MSKTGGVSASAALPCGMERQKKRISPIAHIRMTNCQISLFMTAFWPPSAV